MTDVVVTALVVIGGCCLAVALLLVVVRATRTGRLRRAEQRAAALRPHLLALAAGEDPDGSAARALSELPECRQPELVEATTSLLAKVRGSVADDLVAVLVHRGAVDQAVAGLSSRSAVRRARCARLLGLVRASAAVDTLVPLLSDRSAEVRLVAARSLGMIGAGEAAPAIVEGTRAVHGRIGIPVPVVAESLGNLGAGAVGAVQTGLRSEDPAARHVSAIAARHGQLTTVAPRLRILLASDPDVDVRVVAARALGSMGGAEDVAVLGRATDPRQTAVLRRAAAGALGELGDRHAIPNLLALLADDDRRLAEVAAQSLVRIGRAGVEELEEVVLRAEDPSAQASQRRAARAARSVLELERLRRQGAGDRR